MTDLTQLIERLRAKIEAIPPRDRDWYAVTSPWLGKNEETWIISGSPDPHKGLAVCDFQDVSFAGVEDQFTDEEWTGHNWAMAEFIETADPNAILSLLKEIAELREALNVSDENRNFPSNTANDEIVRDLEATSEYFERLIDDESTSDDSAEVFKRHFEACEEALLWLGTRTQQVLAYAKENQELREALKPLGLDDAGRALEKWRGAPDDRLVAMHVKLGDLRNARAKLEGSGA